MKKLELAGKLIKLKRNVSAADIAANQGWELQFCNKLIEASKKSGIHCVEMFADGFVELEFENLELELPDRFISSGLFKKKNKKGHKHPLTKIFV